MRELSRCISLTNNMAGGGCMHASPLLWYRAKLRPWGKLAWDPAGGKRRSQSFAGHGMDLLPV